MDKAETYDAAIVGGGLAGLAASILLARKGHRVILFEKETYPFHKVCGEYISLESWNFLLSLDLPLDEWQLPKITDLAISSPDGFIINHSLPLGGFGISRHMLDYKIYRLAKENGVEVCDNCRVQDILFCGDHHQIITDKITIRAKICCGAFGKRSNLDVKWKRPFVQQKANNLNNFIGVKYHASLKHPEHQISLHNFKKGYCGISAIEENKYCICYLTTANNLQAYGNNLHRMEQELLSKNPHLRQVFSTATFLYNKPLTISQISFDKKEQIENHVLMLGDAAGLITPLCGNGMSMALHSSKIAAKLVSKFLLGKITRSQLESSYQQDWQKTFANRLLAGRLIQSTFGNEWSANLIMRVLKSFPRVINKIITQTHGENAF